MPLWDMAAFAGFLALWVGYTLLAEHRTLLGRSLSAVMARHRTIWLSAMCDRDNRIGDSNLMANLMRSVSFFASATVLILGGLFALIASGESAYAVFQALPFADASGLVAFETKVVLLAVVFVYAFFQITWSLRQFNYCCILIGAAPPPGAQPSVKAAFAGHAARLQGLAASSFNRGLRAYYFALAMLAWFAGPWAFLAATALVVAVLYRREFRSKTLGVLGAALDDV